MSLESASYIAGIFGAFIAVISLFYTRSQHKNKSKPKSEEVQLSTLNEIAPETADLNADKKFSFNETGIPEDMLISFRAACGMWQKRDRDDALQLLGKKALTQGYEQLALAAASELWHKPTKDQFLLLLIEDLLNKKNATLAYEASELLWNLPCKDKAKTLIVESLGEK